MHGINDQLLSVIIRCDVDDLPALDRGLFYLFSQQYRPIEIVVVISKSLGPNFAAGVNTLRSRWYIYFSDFEVLEEGVGDVLHLECAIQKCNGRYLTIFNLMNKVYPHFYQTAISSLQNYYQYGWANCDVELTHYSSDGKIKRRWAPFLRAKYSFLDNLKFDFVPIDSVIIDRIRVPEIDKFQDHFFSNNDHAIILKIASSYQPIYLSFIGIDISILHSSELLNTDFAEEIIKRYSKFDQKPLGFWWGNFYFSNSDLTLEFLNTEFTQKLLEYEMLKNPEAFKYRRQLAECYASLSWKLSRPARRLVNLIKHAPMSKDEVPDTEAAAISQLILLLNSTSWWVTYPVRLFFK